MWLVSHCSDTPASGKPLNALSSFPHDAIIWVTTSKHQVSWPSMLTMIMTATKDLLLIKFLNFWSESLYILYHLFLICLLFKYICEKHLCECGFTVFITHVTVYRVATVFQHSPLDLWLLSHKRGYRRWDRAGNFPHDTVYEWWSPNLKLIPLKFKTMLCPLCHWCIPRNVMIGSNDMNILKALEHISTSLWDPQNLCPHRPLDLRTHKYVSTFHQEGRGIKAGSL